MAQRIKIVHPMRGGSFRNVAPVRAMRRPDRDRRKLSRVLQARQFAFSPAWLAVRGETARLRWQWLYGRVRDWFTRMLRGSLEAPGRQIGA